MKKLWKALLILAVVAAFAALSCACSNEKTITLDDGSTYVGEVEDGVPNGHGVLTDQLGSTYEGNFVDGKLQGWGTYVGFDYTEYEGQFVDGEFEGFGHVIFSNGDEFWGQFVDGIRNGVGRQQYTTACDYEGGWVDGYMEGMGWMTWPCGDVYFGQWFRGDPSGFGCKVFYDPAFSIKDEYETYNIYVGNMEGNMMNGWGIMRFGESGGIYMGNWDTGIRDDTNGIYYFEEGGACMKFIGSFSATSNSGWIWGDGTMYYSNGLAITGRWEGTTLVEEYSRSYFEPETVSAERDAAEAQVLEDDNLESMQDNSQ